MWAGGSLFYFIGHAPPDVAIVTGHAGSFTFETEFQEDLCFLFHSLAELNLLKIGSAQPR